MSREEQEEETYFEEKASDEVLRDLCCFEVQNNEEAIPDGYNAATVIIDVTKDATLQWDKERKRIDELIANKKSLVFDLKIDFGCEPAIHNATCFAIEHFIKTLWIDYYDHASGIIACRKDLIDNEFLRGLESLFEHVAFHIPIFLLLDCSNQKDLQQFMQLSSKDAFDRFYLALKNPSLITGRVVWQEGSDMLGYIGRDLSKKIALTQEIRTAVLFSQDALYDYSPILQALQERNIPFKIIAEKCLTLDWQDIDDLLLCTEPLSTQTKRELSGFCAAGGRVIFLDKGTGFKNELSFEKWARE